MSRRDRQPVPPTGVVALNRHDRKRAAVHHPPLGDTQAGYACKIAGTAARLVSPSGLVGPPGGTHCRRSNHHRRGKAWTDESRHGQRRRRGGRGAAP